MPTHDLKEPISSVHAAAYAFLSSIPLTRLEIEAQTAGMGDFVDEAAAVNMEGAAAGSMECSMGAEVESAYAAEEAVTLVGDEFAVEDLRACGHEGGLARRIQEAAQAGSEVLTT